MKSVKEFFKKMVGAEDESNTPPSDTEVAQNPTNVETRAKQIKDLNKKKKKMLDEIDDSTSAD